ncbi:hypothetical protein Tco_0992239 [Tanacetum coccineum]|uniref:Uncharacterized protein n=1 Tax=Tanacetum coccineum TaxID=301880 RepID=A0ABQ5F1R4_9ASTR
MDRFLRTTRVGIDHLHSLAYVSWTSSVRPDHDHFLRGTTLRSEQAACTVSIILFFFDFSLTFIGARDVALDEIPDVLPSPVCEWTLLFLSPNRVKTFLSLGPSLVNIVAFTGLLRQVGLSPSCHSLEKALVFCEGRVSLDAVTGLGLLFLVLLFMSHDLDSENLVCDFDASFHLFLENFSKFIRGKALRITVGCLLAPLTGFVFGPTDGANLLVQNFLSKNNVLAMEVESPLSDRGLYLVNAWRVPAKKESTTSVDVGYAGHGRSCLGYRYHRLLSVFGTLTFFLDFLCPVSYSFDPVTGGRLSWSELRGYGACAPCGAVVYPMV